MNEQDDLMTVRDVARECGRTEETVRRWIWSGKLRARKLGNQMFVLKDDLEAMRAPRAGESQAVYSVHPHEPGPKPFTGEEFEEWLARVRQLRGELITTYGPVNVTELLREIREEED